MITRRRFLTALPGAIGATGLRLRAQGRSALAGVWCGGVTSSSAVVKALTAPGAVVAFDLPSVLPSVTKGFPKSLTADAAGVATFDVQGLSPRTRYRYTVTAPGEAPLECAFRTFGDGAFSCRLLFASCASTGSSSAVFTAMRQMQPDLFIHLGDLHYENITRNEVRRFQQAYERVLASPTQSALFRFVPLAYTWDDHDYGSNNADRTSPSRAAALEAYRSYIPHYPLAGGPTGPIHHAFSIGRVRVIMTDTRSERSPDNLPEAQRTMLGAAQLAWLEREFEAATAAPLVLLVNTVPWITKRNESTNDGWARYGYERRHIADLIVRLGLTRKLVMLSGDAHMLAMDDGTHSQYSTLPEAPARGFAIAHAAPMDMRTTQKGGPYSHPAVRRDGQFGVVDVTDEGGPITVRLQGMQGTTPVPGMSMTLTL